MQDKKRPGFGGMDEGYTIDHVVESGKLITKFGMEYTHLNIEKCSNWLKKSVFIQHKWRKCNIRLTDFGPKTVEIIIVVFDWAK